ncbi:MAG TPA: helix-turn-helix transcriptional regulator [Gaiellaceae bacterium]
MAKPRSPAHLAYGRALREVRLKRGISQERLAHLSGLDRTYVSGIERGERNPSLTNILKLVDALDISLSELANKAKELMAERPVGADGPRGQLDADPP